MSAEGELVNGKPAFVLPELEGPNGNAFWLLGHAKRVLRAADYPQSAIDSFYAEATAGDYDHLLAQIKLWFTVVVPQVTYTILEEEED